MPPEIRRGARETAIFGEMMIRKFEQRAHRGDWKDLPFYAAWQNLNDEIHELCDAISRCDRPNAIDVANSCLILVDVLKGLKVKCDKCNAYMDCVERKVWDDNENCEVIDMYFRCPKCKALKEAPAEG